MPRAGWCRECGEWIWVDDDGACQNGHGPESVESVYNAVPTPVQTAFGVGDDHPLMHRFNWGAFLMPALWGLVYGVVPVLGAWVIALAIMLLTAPPDKPVPTVTAMVSFAVLAQVASGAARLWVGANANRWLWAKESRRLELIPDAVPKFTIERYTQRQRLWTIIGAAVLAVSTLVVAPFESAAWKPYGLTIAGAAMPAVWLGAEVLLGLWLDSRMRAEAQPGQPASDSA